MNSRKDAFNSDRIQVTQSLEAAKAALYRERSEYEIEFKKWNEEWNVLISRAKDLDRLIDLNVGGKNITVSISNLT